MIEMMIMMIMMMVMMMMMMMMTVVVVVVAQAVTFGDHVEVQCMSENACYTFHVHKSHNYARTMLARIVYSISGLIHCLLVLIHGNVT